MLLQVEHISTYRYAKPVKFGPHRLLVRPLEGHDIQIRESALRIEPAATVRWVHDVFDNSVAIASFENPASELRIESCVTVEQFNENPLDFVLEPFALEVPFQYPERELSVLAPYLSPQFPQSQSAVAEWLRPFLKLDRRAKTLDFLMAIIRAMPMFFAYSQREEEGTQPPEETIRKRSGSCRDFAVLLMEAARNLGLAARFVSGYLCSSDSPAAEAASQSTHAWAEVYLPGAGWKGFDPTCGIMAAQHHLRVAVVKEPSQAPPISGSYAGEQSAFLGMDVRVKATAV